MFHFQLRKEKATEIVIEEGAASENEGEEQEPLVLPDDDSSDGMSGDESDANEAPPNDDFAIDSGMELWTAEAATEGGIASLICLLPLSSSLPSSSLPAPCTHHPLSFMCSCLPPVMPWPHPDKIIDSG